MVRGDTFNHLLHFKQLTCQLLVDAYAKIESERLLFFRLNQKKLRAEEYIHLRDSMNADGQPSNIGQPVILPSNFVGGPRYMAEKTQDAMVYVRKFGRPDLFITFTCNRKWEEITRELFTHQQASDRHDLIARVFHEKQKKLIWLIRDGAIFGDVQCWLYSIEWQKRGLPHSHNLIWCKDKIRPCDIDNIISAELPNPDEDPDLFEIIKTQLIHGPCKRINPRAPCMKDGKCTKRYPRDFLQNTQTGEDGYPLYRRRSPQDGGHTTKVYVKGKEIVVDNRWVVPHNKMLCKIFQAHINVEYACSVKAIKYVCAYVNKGSDMATFAIEGEGNADEVQKFQTGRYISSNEAMWRILDFNIHEHAPTVTRLSVHLPNGQRVYFTEENAQERATTPPETTLTAFFKLCQSDVFAKTLLYAEVPTYYTWQQVKVWKRRIQGIPVEGYPGVKASDAIGRVYTVHPNNKECFFLRLLLHTVRGPTSFEDLRCHDGIVYQTFREACCAYGLLEDDEHWKKTLQEAASTQKPIQLRRLFAIMLSFCEIAQPLALWNSHKDDMSEDILYRIQRQNPAFIIGFNNEIYNEALLDIEKHVTALGCTMINCGMPQPEGYAITGLNRELLRETNYNT